MRNQSETLVTKKMCCVCVYYIVFCNIYQHLLCTSACDKYGKFHFGYTQCTLHSVMLIAIDRISLYEMYRHLSLAIASKQHLYQVLFVLQVFSIECIVSDSLLSLDFFSFHRSNVRRQKQFLLLLLFVL